MSHSSNGDRLFCTLYALLVFIHCSKHGSEKRLCKKTTWERSTMSGTKFLGLEKRLCKKKTWERSTMSGTKFLGLGRNSITATVVKKIKVNS